MDVAMPFIYADGGRAAAGFKGETRDCVTRAIAIATGQDYQAVYDDLNALAKARGESTSSARTGVQKPTTRAYMASLGWAWVPCMGIGTGCTVHLAPGELPMGRLVVQCSRHVVAVIDGVVHDTHNPSRGGTRCVYGYWSINRKEQGS